MEGIWKVFQAKPEDFSFESLEICRIPGYTPSLFFRREGERPGINSCGSHVKRFQNILVGFHPLSIFFPLPEHIFFKRYWWDSALPEHTVLNPQLLWSKMKRDFRKWSTLKLSCLVRISGIKNNHVTKANFCLRLFQF